MRTRRPTPSSTFSCDLLGEFGLRDLAQSGEWKLVDDDEALGPLLFHQASLVQKGAQLVEREVALPGRASDDRADRFPAEFIRLAHHRDLADERVCEQLVLDLVGGDVLALADDHILASTGDDDSSVGPEVAEVAGAEPAVRSHGA